MNHTNIQTIDNRRNIVVPGNLQETIKYCIDQFITLANRYIEEKGVFSVALSGGSTPKEIFKGLASEENREKVDWKKVLLFWSDERSVPPDDLDSNYRMAMDAGFSSLPIPKENIFRMKAEEEPEFTSKEYEKLIMDKLSGTPLDMVMLGMGSDGHTASLFPKTHALHPSANRLVVENYVPKMDTWRMTMTFSCINAARHIVIYALGGSKAEILETVMTSPYDPDTYPIQGIGTSNRKALFIVDDDAAAHLKKILAYNNNH